MAYNRNGQPYQGQYSQYQASNPQQQQYQNQQRPPQPGQGGQAHRQGQSFDNGDDAAYPNRGDGNAYHSGGNGGAYVHMPDGPEFMGGGPPAPGRGHTGSLSSQQYQATPNPQPPLRPHLAYNPQQYAPAGQYSVASLSSPTVASSPSIGHQPYNPAAYSSATSPSSHYGFPLYEAAAARRQHSVQYQNVPSLPQRPSLPELPPRPWLQQQQPQQSQAYPQATATGFPEGHGNLAQSPPLASSVPLGNAYTPPRPPPPPTGVSSYYSDASPQTQQHSQDAYRLSNSRHGSESASHQHRLPSLPNYQGSGDYATPQAQGRTSASPKPPYSTPPQRSDTTGRHPQSRPLPAQPPAAYEEEIPEEDAGQGESFGYDAILQEVEAAVMGRPTPSDRRASPPKPEPPSRSQTGTEVDPLFPSRPSIRTRTNGVTTDAAVNYRGYSDDSDAEAAAGLAAMQMAEEQDAADQAWRSGSQHRQDSYTSQPGLEHHGSHRRQDSYASQPGLEHYDPRRHHGLPPVPNEHGTSSDSDQIQVDMDTYGGGLPGGVNYHYGYGPGSETPRTRPQHSHTQSAASVPYSDLSSEALGTPAIEYYLPGEESIHPFPSFARTDTGDTGGNVDANQLSSRKLSFEDGDEGNHYDNFDHESSGAASPSRDGHQHQRSNSRPLPHVPRRGAIDYKPLSPDDNSGYPQDVDDYDSRHGATAAMQKANSVGSRVHPSHPAPPGRSITDAEVRRRAQAMPGRPDDGLLSPESAHAPRDKLGEIVLPSLPAGKRRKFVPSKLSSHDYKRCPEPWALSAILAWLKEMSEGEADLKRHLLVDGLVALFTNKVPTMNTADAEVLSANLVEQMFEEGAVLQDEEWVKFTDVSLSGVIFQLTGTGCYASILHNHSTPGRCYSHHCMRTLKKVDLATQGLAPQRKVEDWATFYKLKNNDIEGVEKKEIERQNNLHEIITSEDVYMDQLDVLRILYRDGLKKSTQPIMSKNHIDDFTRDVFGKVDAVKRANEDYLLPQLKYRQREQGPWIKGFADIFREWIRKAKAAYIDYAAHFPMATLKVRKEAERNVLFRQFLDQMRENERSKRLGWDTYLKSPITRLQRYSLLLATVHKHTLIDNEEKKNLTIAIEEIKNVTLECDSRVAEMQKRTDLMELASKLKLRPGMEKVQLNLNHLGREVIFRGDLQRKGSNRISWVDTHAILFDHFMVLAKPVQQRDAVGGLRHEVYDISKLPIPMDLLVLESTNDDAVMKSSVKGITTAANRAQTPQDNRLGRATSSSTGVSSTNLSSQQPTNSSMSISSGSSRNMANQAVLADSANDKTLYPFRIKHLGKSETYVLYAASSGNRQDWCDSIIEAKTRHASALHAQNAEPFRLRVLGDTAFNYDSTYISPPTVVIKGTPLDRAIEECDKSFYGTGPRAPPVCRAAVHCSTSFQQSYGARMMAIGTDFGVFLSEYSNPRGWVKSNAITVGHVTQMAVLEEFSLFLILAEKSLIAYNLESVCPPAAGGGPPSGEARKPPQKLSGSKDVGFFSIGRQKDRTLIFYKKKDGINSNFKVLEPVYTRSAQSTRSRFGLKKGSTDYCRDFDEFYIPSDTFSINLFDKSLAVSTARGIEVLTLDKKVPWSIPDLRAAAVATIAARLKDNDPLGMFRLNDEEFLLVFEGVGIYVDKHGDISRAVVMEFVGRAKQAALYLNKYLVLVDKGAGFVEVRNAINGRLRQVVSGRDVRLIDDATMGGSIKICLQHPERERVQLVVEMIVNDGLKE